MNKLWVRLSLGFLVLTWAVLGVVALVVYNSVQTSFRAYVSERDAALFGSPLIDDLVNYYRTAGSWEGVTALLGQPGHGRGAGGRGPQTFIATPDHVIVAATDAAWVGQKLEAIGASRTTPLLLDGQVIGILGQQTPGEQALEAAEARFVEQVNWGLIWAGGVTTLLALGLGVLLAFSLTRPLQLLAMRLARWTAATVGEQVPVEGSAEVRQLATEFNAMSQRLADAEAVRQQMATDVAHELRTPVTVLRGHLEAMMDGVYPLDVEHVAVAYEQTLHLNRLVEDLRLLTQAEAGRLPLKFELLAPDELLQQAATRFAPLAQDAGVNLVDAADAALPSIRADRGRLLQVFDNLLTNALRHTPAGGVIRLHATQTAGGVRFVVANTGEIDAETAAHLFDRFWRADEARSRDAGGSGLGLAITRQLVRLHQGEIRVEAGEGETRFVIELPVAPS
ncbi:MAG TPA: HAMP domain-containing protein [Chloroflexi bacterium]|nr:HAMP domain-containing protein [Chloroflexota bacterium]